MKHTLEVELTDVRKGDRIKMPTGEWATVETNAVENTRRRVGTTNRASFDIRYDDQRCHHVSGMASVVMSR